MKRRFCYIGLFSNFLTRFSAILLIGALGAVQAAWALVPDLPVEWRDTNNKNASGKMVLLDFYSDYCGTCRMMAPHLAFLNSKVGDRVTIRHLNVASRSLRPWIQQYRIASTPTYVLYNPQGKAIYRMEDRISGPVLKNEVFRAAGRLKPILLPEGLGIEPPASGRELSWGNMILLSFERNDCETCRAMQPYLNGFEKAGHSDGLRVIRINAGLSGEQDIEKKRLKAWMAELNIRQFPTYLLLDNAQSATHSLNSPEHGELFRVSGKVQPGSLWELIRMFGQPGV